VLVILVFSGVSGAALADIGALGKMQVDEMVRQGYDRGFASGVTVAAATIGPIFPPSIPIIIYASVANVSAVKLLVAGILPALLIAVLLMAQIAWRARGGRLPKDDGTAAGAGALRTIGMAVPALLAPAIMIGGLLSGWFGPTEVAGVTVAYALLVGVLFYRSLTVRAVVDAFAETALAAANVLLVVSAAAMFAWILTLDRAPTVVGEALVALTTDPVMLLLLVNAMLLILGMVLESIAAILILAPIIAPALHMAGVDPLHLGIVFVLNLMIGLMTPPVGMSLYMVSIVTGTPVGRVIRGVLPFLAPLLLALLAVTFVPELATWLPGLLD
jgi:tripartite ATP-independent transporter DctM subunit